ncbi:MAG: histidinol dehydrogenase [Desulfobacteraceae bacterium]|nr:histidinol dehydrogenase [Desulfobacteraceae bacterium]
MKIFNYPSANAEKRLSDIVHRGLGYTKKQLQYVTGILEDVQKNGDQAVLAYTNRFDSPKVTLENLKVSKAELDSAEKSVNRKFLAAMNRSATQIKGFHTQQARNSWINTDRPGTLLGQVIRPVETVGVYVPGATGGKTPLVSSVLMGAIPAVIAGVKNIILVTPPRQDGTIDPHLLAAAKKVGVTSVFKTGSAWAIAALAYGTDLIPKADVIVGPGNLYVTLAKKILSGTVGIDMIAGPSEILILADSSANPEFIAADLLSQAEHAPDASSVLLTDDPLLAAATAKALERQLEALDRKDVAEQSLNKFGAIIVTPDIEVAVELANRIAPEHLELHVKEPFELLGSIRNAGAVFLGEYTPEPVGDYIAGPNHVLPTAGTARFASALSVDNFIKKISILHYSKAAFEKEARDIMLLAGAEGLGAHANSIRVRLKK